MKELFRGSQRRREVCSQHSVPFHIILFYFSFLKVTAHSFLPPSNPVQINLTLLLRNSDEIKVFLHGDEKGRASAFRAEIAAPYF